MTATATRSIRIDPAILYWGTPVVLVSTRNADGSANLAPISSAFWLGRTATLGSGLSSHSLANLRRTGECVLAVAHVTDHAVVQVEVLAVHVDPAVRLSGSPNRVDPDAWRPLIMSFQRFYGLGAEVHPSRLASIDEEAYR